MENEIMDLDQLASYLMRDARELSKMANRGHLPGQKVGGTWRFASAEINHWVETQMHAYTEQELTALEAGTARGQLDHQPLISALLSETIMAVPLLAGTRDSVLRELVKLAENCWQVYDPSVLLTAIQQRMVACKEMIPERAAKIPEADRAKFLAHYRKEMAGVIIDFCQVEQAILDGDNAKATELYQASLKMWEQVKDKPLKDYEIVVSNYADLLRSLGQVRKAHQLEVRARKKRSG